jgi:F0F1-type ATP synthase membrane subunit a
MACCFAECVPVIGIHFRGRQRFEELWGLSCFCHLLPLIAEQSQPTFLMLPFNIIGELSRTLALAVRLFGNIMSGTMIVAILLTITPLVFPIFMTLLALLTGMVQAYIFSILATVYIAAAVQTRQEQTV